jgi:inner membrane protein
VGVAPFVWAIAGLLLMAAEAVMPGFFIIFAGAGGLVTAALTALLPGLAARPPAQLLVWAASSAVMLALLRRALRLRFGGRDAAEDSVGARAVVVEPIAPGSPGRIRLAGTTWRAESYDETFAAGEVVDVLAREGLTCYVSRPMLGR